jgi:hypothetical protein
LHDHVAFLPCPLDSFWSVTVSQSLLNHNLEFWVFSTASLHLCLTLFFSWLAWMTDWRQDGTEWVTWLLTTLSRAHALWVLWVMSLWH